MDKDLKIKWKEYLIKFILVCIFLEILLRIFGVNKTSEEKQLNTYSYKFQSFKNTWFHTWPPNTTIKHGLDEFKYTNSYNELGHRETSYQNFQEDTSSVKIICLGDSFTEGDGAPYDSSWVRFFENSLSTSLDTNVLAYNAGVCGSDALFDFQMLKENLLSSNPKIVIECLNNSDITDIYYRGGPERFLPDGTTGAPNAKKWEVLYKYSYVFRALLTTFTPYDNNLINNLTIDAEEEQALKVLAKQVNETYAFCKKNKIQYYLVMTPVPSDIENKNFYIFESLPDYLDAQIPLINLYPKLYDKYDSIDIEDYSWERNGHFNGKGYQVLSNALFDEFYNLKPSKELFLEADFQN
ncbi:MAG: hypothetical protein H6579_04920 [Chitinophagales bacterium]|nr:hypothetical protein [Chitinophagales bacterium]